MEGDFNYEEKSFLKYINENIIWNIHLLEEISYYLTDFSSKIIDVLFDDNIFFKDFRTGLCINFPGIYHNNFTTIFVILKNSK